MLTEYSEALAREETNRLIKRLSAQKSEWPSEMSLRTLNPQVVDSLITRFAEIEGIEVSDVKTGLLLSLLIPLELALCWILFSVLPDRRWLAHTIMAAMLALFGLGCTWLCIHAGPGRKLPYMVYALTQTDDVRVLETLIVATHYKWGRHPEVIKAVNRLLEQVTEADAGLLNDRAQERLWTIGIAPQTLSDAYDPQTATVALQALAAVGNHATLTRMEQYVAPSLYSVGERHSIDAVRRALPIIQARLKRRQDHETLLRAADVTDVQNHLLLRTVQTPVVEPPHELLRPPTAERPEPDA
jgi:hypothetical protein